MRILYMFINRGRANMSYSIKRPTLKAVRYNFRRQCNEKPSTIPGCPGSLSETSMKPLMSRKTSGGHNVMSQSITKIVSASAIALAARLSHSMTHIGRSQLPNAKVDTTHSAAVRKCGIFVSRQLKVSTCFRFH